LLIDNDLSLDARACGRVARVTERARWAWLLATVVMGIGLLAGAGILYTNSVERAGQRDLCELIAVFDDPAAPPATTDRGRAQQTALRAYRAKRC
jgi:H+/Cl- antiporter ClcA